MTLSFTGRKRLRKFFGKMHEVAEMPNLIEVQRTSYDQFLQVDKPERGRLDEGLQAVFSSVFPIKDFSEKSLIGKTERKTASSPSSSRPPSGFSTWRNWS